MTPTQKALRIIAGHSHFSATQFAGLMWPDHPGWRRISKQGHGACSGKGMWFAAGCLLGKMEKRGLIVRGFVRYSVRKTTLTEKGRQLLAQATATLHSGPREE